MIGCVAVTTSKSDVLAHHVADVVGVLAAGAADGELCQVGVRIVVVTGGGPPDDASRPTRPRGLQHIVCTVLDYEECYCRSESTDFQLPYLRRSLTCWQLPFRSQADLRLWCLNAKTVNLRLGETTSQSHSRRKCT